MSRICSRCGGSAGSYCRTCGKILCPWCADQKSCYLKSKHLPEDIPSPEPCPNHPLIMLEFNEGCAICANST